MQNKKYKKQKKIRLEEKREKEKEIIRSLEKKLFQKIYFDLFSSIPNTFQENNLTFENFIYIFSSSILKICNFKSENQSYPIVLKKVSDIVIKRYSITPDLRNMNPLQIKKYLYDKNLNDDWTIVENYQIELSKEEEKKRLREIAENMNQYYNDLKQQEIEKLNIAKELEKKRKKLKEELNREEEEKIHREKVKNDLMIKQLLANEKLMTTMNKQKIKNIAINEKAKKEYLNEIIKENEKLNKDNKDIVKYKIDNIMKIQNKQFQNINKTDNTNLGNINEKEFEFSSDEISKIVDRMMEESQLKKNNDLIYNRLKDLNSEIQSEKLDEIIQKEEFELNKKKDNEYINISEIKGIEKEISQRVDEILSKNMKYINLKKNEDFHKDLI
jgi:hypothetical protein